MIDEMEKKVAFSKELDFENNIRKIIADKIIGQNNDFTLLESKNVADIIICRNTSSSKIFFIEVKHYSPKNMRIGFGGGKGRKSFQPEILTKRPKYFEENLIWVFGQENDDHYYVLNNDDCSKYIAAENIGDKQNNFQRKLFEEISPLSENEFLSWVKDWLWR